MEDDQDGVVEAINANIDHDNDNIPDYLDQDDDNDSILTINEVFDNDGDNVYETIPDTDNDGIPDYLDKDDDGDGILTINEILDSNGDDIKDYLDENIAIAQEDSGIVAPNEYNLQYTMSIIIKNMSLVNSSGNAINYTNYEYGVKVGNFTIDQ